MELALKKSSSTREKELALGIPATEANVFISLEKTVEKLKSLIAARIEGVATFIRAPVAAGKTTLATYLVHHSPDEFVKISMFPNDTEDQITRKIIKASQAETLEMALKELKDKGKTLIFDEVHLLFAFPDLVTSITKDSESSKPDIVFFSAAATGKDKEGNTVLTEIRKKYMWYPPIPDSETLAIELKRAGVHLSSYSVDFFLKICGSHRGIFVSAMQWVQERQEGLTDEWDIHQSVAEVRASFEESMKDNLGGWSMGLRE